MQFCMSNSNVKWTEFNDVYSHHSWPAEEATTAGQMPQAAFAALRDVGLVSLAGSWNRRGSTEMAVIIRVGTENKYPLVNYHSYWKLKFIVDLTIKNDGFP